ncbi:hypothetical protein SAMN04488516_10919 [Desulfonauticus submarinus]|uniref:Lipoprotein n=1 Tax=Desulfonauticus submarinus TaxID=206665 RepID=A0A1H0ERN0_9BACT|nr:hypothetical protein [Desulfonauticus submarinus]SDN85021.1 hypothetical protein SAMN04488516_10919 [Desulfonauticus submarinus]
MKKIFLTLLSIVLINGCTYKSKHIVDNNPIWMSYPYIYGPPIVQKSCAPLYFYPRKTKKNSSTTAIFFPFYCGQQPRDFQLETRMGQIFFRIWQGEKIFPKSFFINQHLHSKEEALNIASKQNAFAVIGEITYVLDGGSLGESVLSLHLEIYSPKGELLWSLSHAGRIDNPPLIDWYIIKKQILMPEDGLGYLISSLALDLARPIYAWARGKDYKKFIYPKKNKKQKPSSSNLQSSLLKKAS